MSIGTLCPFCSIPEGRIVEKNEHAMAILDGFPVSPGHSLVIPKRHVASYFEITGAEREALLALLDSAKARIEQQHQPAGFNIGINDGAAAGQTVAVAATAILLAMIVSMLIPFVALVSQIMKDATEAERKCFWGGMFFGIGLAGLPVGVMSDIVGRAIALVSGFVVGNDNANVCYDYPSIQ